MTGWNDSILISVSSFQLLFNVFERKSTVSQHAAQATHIRTCPERFILLCKIRAMADMHVDLRNVNGMGTDQLTIGGGKASLPDLFGDCIGGNIYGAH
jgi:hypothetical protein